MKIIGRKHIAKAEKRENGERIFRPEEIRHYNEICLSTEIPFLSKSPKTCTWSQSLLVWGNWPCRKTTGAATQRRGASHRHLFAEVRAALSGAQRFVRLEPPTQNLAHCIGDVYSRIGIELGAELHVGIEGVLHSDATLGSAELVLHSLRTQPTHPLPIEPIADARNVGRSAFLLQPTALAFR